MGPEKALCALAPAPHLSLAREGPARGHLRKDTTLASGSCIRESGTLLGKPSSAPMRVCSGQQRFQVGGLAHCLPKEQRGSGLPPAPCALVLCRSSLELENNSNHSLFQGEGRWGLKRPCGQGPKHPTPCQVWRDPAMAISEKAQN